MGELDGYCLYTLSDNGKVIYVGITSWLMQRYRQHCTIRWNEIGNYVYWMKHRRCLPDLNIVEVFDSKQEAEYAENVLIEYFVSIDHKLCNNDRNPLYNRYIMCISHEKAPRLGLYAKNKVNTAINNYKTRKAHADKYRYK